jgi:hypothetical protein
MSNQKAPPSPLTVRLAEAALGNLTVLSSFWFDEGVFLGLHLFSSEFFFSPLHF